MQCNSHSKNTKLLSIGQAASTAKCEKKDVNKFKQTTKVPPLFSLNVINCRSAKKNGDSIHNHIIEHNSECIALTETWLKRGDEVLPHRSKLVPNGYQFISVPRPKGRGGGVAVLCKDQYHMTQDHGNISKKSFEYMAVKVTAASYTFRIIVIYRVNPSKKNKLSKSDFIEEFSDLLEHEATQSGKLLITGDFNIHWDNEKDNEQAQFATLLESFELEQHVSGSTHRAGHTLDLLLSRREDDIVHSCSVGHFIADHNALQIDLKCGKIHPPRKVITYRPMRTIDVPSFIADLKSSSLFSHENIPLDTLVDKYNSVLEELLNKHAPLKEKVVVERPTQQQWITEDILAAKRERRKSEKIYRKTGLKSDREKYRRSCEKVKDLICKAKAKYYQDKVEQCEGDQKKTI